MIPQNPTFIPRPFAAEGVAATIPDDKTVFGEASWREGFPTETGLPLNAGGIPPRKADFNGTLKTITEHTFFQQAGCVYPWSDQIDYPVGSHVMGANNHEYTALKASGPATEIVDPAQEEASQDMTWLDVTAKLQDSGDPEKLKTPRAIDGVLFDGSANIIHYGTCGTAAATAAKVVACTGFTLTTGARICVKFTVTNTANNPTLNVNGTGAKQMRFRNAQLKAYALSANGVYDFVYDGTYYCLVEDVNIDVGEIKYRAQGTVPAGFLVCNGAAVSRTTYAALFAVIGTTYGEGDGSTTFNVPELRNRVIWGHTTVGTVKAAGLPNITGKLVPPHSLGYGAQEGEGAIGAYSPSTQSRIPASTNYGNVQLLDFDASRSNSIYGASTTVQPPALTLLPCIKY